MDDQNSSSKLLDRLNKAENLLLTFLGDSERILRSFFSEILPFATEQIEFKQEENDIADASAEAFRKLNEIGQKLKEITKDLPMDIPKQPKKDNAKRMLNENFRLVLENCLNEITTVVEKEKTNFQNPPHFNELDA